ncbi:MAG: hypothetical protein H6613_03380 [Ignavibacteriales bacterium]|nr:hypothetical protein [Ignavibacteriales bacterium]
MSSENRNYILIVLTLLTTNIFSQNEKSIQVNGGILFPRSSSNGLSGSIQLNYGINSDLYLYLYSGYSSWDKFNIGLNYQYSEVEDKEIAQQRTIATYAENEHSAIPFYLGARLNFRTNKLFTTFFSFELGYSRLAFNSYNKWDPVYSNSGAVVQYIPVESSKIKKNENLYGFGVGLGFAIPATTQMDVIVNFKLNTYSNFDDIELLSTRGHIHTTILGGLNFKI